MGKDGIRPPDKEQSKKRPVSASPYSENYRPSIDLCQRHLINHRLMVAKLTRRELEDKYINLCDENFSIKKRFQEQEEQIKRLKTKLMRFSSESSRSKSKQDLTSDHRSLHDLESQRRELRQRLEALRRNQRKESRKAEHEATNRRRSKSARRARDHDGDSKSSTSSNEDEDRFDEDRDEESPSESEPDPEYSGASTSKVGHQRARPCADCERLQAEKVTHEAEYVEMKLNVKYLNKEIQNEKEKNALLARQLEEKLSYEIMKRNTAENLEILTLNRQIEDMSKQLQRQADDQKRAIELEMKKQLDLEAQIRKEKDKNAVLFEECERLKKNIERLKENMSEVEIERDFLKRQQENFTKIVDENKLLRYQLEELRKQNETLLKQIESLKEEETVTRSAQKELLEKLKNLQQDNDTLSVLLEGLRTENETLVEEKSVLERNLKSLEASPLQGAASPLPKEDCAVQTEPVPVAQPLSNLLDTAVALEPETVPGGTSSRPTVPQRSSLKSLRASQDPAVNEGTPRHTAKQVRITQILPKMSILQNNRIDSESRVNGVQLLISNAYTEALQKTFKSYKPFVEMQQTILAGSPSTSTTSENQSIGRRAISFELTEDEKRMATDEDEYVKESFARYFSVDSAKLTRAVTAQSTSNSPSHSEEQLTIEISSLQWHPDALTGLLQQAALHFYIEFSFLDVWGHQLETPFTSKLLDATGQPRLTHDFNFRVAFELDEQNHGRRRLLLAELLAPGGNDAIRFVVVCEGHEWRGRCTEIGYATVHLGRELHDAPSSQDVLKLRTPIHSFYGAHDEIGTLLTVFEGIRFLRAISSSSEQ